MFKNPGITRLKTKEGMQDRISESLIWGKKRKNIHFK